MLCATVKAVVQAAWKLKPPVMPSISNTSPAKYRWGMFLHAKVEGLTAERLTPPQVTPQPTGQGEGTDGSQLLLGMLQRYK